MAQDLGSRAVAPRLAHYVKKTTALAAEKGTITYKLVDHELQDNEEIIRGLQRLSAELDLA